MHLYSNHIICHESTWNLPYSCRHCVEITEYEGKYGSENYQKNVDWDKILENISYQSLSAEKTVRKLNPGASEADIARWSKREVARLKPEVEKWLLDMVADRKGEECTKGWAIGTDDYNERMLIKVLIFFIVKRML